MNLTLNIEKTRIIALYSSKRLRRISKIIVDKLSSQGNIILQSYPDEDDRIIFRKIDLADELFIVDNMPNNEYSKIVEYARTHGKKIRFLSQTSLSNLINEYRSVKKHLRSMRKSIIEYDNLRKRYHEVKGEIIETRL